MPTSKFNQGYSTTAQAMIKSGAAGMSPDRMVENLIKSTSPLQVTQQGAMDAMMDLYSALPADRQASLDPFIEKYDQDPMYTIDVMLGEATRDSTVEAELQQQLMLIAARFNLTIPK